MIPFETASAAVFGILAGTPQASEAPKGFMSALPDPMKLSLGEIGFVIVLLTVMFLLLKALFFRPLMKVVDERESAIESGAEKRAEAAALVAARQNEHASRLRELRAKAFEHRKTLSEAAADEKQRLLDAARGDAGQLRSSALAELEQQREASKAELLQQIDVLSDAMVKQLLKQA